MHRVIVNGGRIMRVVSLDSDPLAEQADDERSLEALMRRRPTPEHERRAVRVTRNGNMIIPVAR